MPPSSPWTQNAKHAYNPTRGFPELGSDGDQQPIGSSEEYRTRQDDEIEALRSIFMDDYQETSTGSAAWNVSSLGRKLCSDGSP